MIRIGQRKYLNDANLLDIFNISLVQARLFYPELENQEFIDCILNPDNYEISSGHKNNLRSRFKSQNDSIVSEFLNRFCQENYDLFWNLFKDNRDFSLRWVNSDLCKNKIVMSADILRDQPGFSMRPHIDNNQVVVQSVFNLIKDNDSATDFYSVNARKIYTAPREMHNGVIFLNSSGAVHGIENPRSIRYILYAGLTVTLD